MSRTSHITKGLGEANKQIGGRIVRSPLLLASALVLSACSAPHVLGQEYDFSQFIPHAVGYGSRAHGMGGACTSLACDLTAVACNPAGLGRLRRSQVMVAGRFTFGSLKPNVLGTESEDTSIETSASSTLSPEFVGLAFPLYNSNLRLMGAIVVRSIFDFPRSIHFRCTEDTSEPESYREIARDQQGGIYSLSTTVGANLHPRVSAGITLNFVSGRSEIGFTDTYISAEEAEPDSAYYRENKFSGFFVDLGIRFTPADDLFLGFVVSTPYTLKFAGITEMTNRETTNNLEDFGLKLPMFVSLGAAFQPTQRLSLAIDFRWRPWSYASVDSTVSNTKLPFGNVNTFHVGIEYILHTAEMSFPLRFGFHTDPRISRGFDPNSPDAVGDQVRAFALTCGAGLHLARLMFDLSIDYSFGKHDIRNPFCIEPQGWEVEEDTIRVVASVSVHVR